MCGKDLKKEKALELKRAPILSEHCCLSPSWKFVNPFLCIYLTAILGFAVTVCANEVCVEGRACVLLG